MKGRIYNIGNFKIEVKPETHGFTYQGDKECQHRNLIFLSEGEIIQCKDCNLQVTAWWALKAYLREYESWSERFEREYAQLQGEKGKNLTHKAALAVETAWRRKNLIPTCPHCTKPILPGDGFGSGGVGKHYASNAKPMEFRQNLEIVAGYKLGDVNG